MILPEADDRLRLRSLEYFLTDRCNLRCANCSASSPFLRDPNVPEITSFRKSLEALEPVLFTEQLKLLGGEPLLNRRICEFMDLAARSGLCDRIRVATNGTLLHRMGDRFWELVDVVEVSLYPEVKGPNAEQLSVFQERAARAGSVLEVHRIGRFMQASTVRPHADRETTERVFRTCAEAHDWSCHLLYDGRLYRCSRVHTLDRYLTGAGVPHAAFTEEDGLPILDRPPDELLRGLRAYLTSDTPLEACSFCLGTSGQWQACRQLSAAEVRDGSGAGPIRLVSEAEARLRARVATWAEAKERGVMKGHGADPLP